MKARGGWLIYYGLRIWLGDVSTYKRNGPMVHILTTLGEEFTISSKDSASAEELLIALDQHFGVSEDETTIELKP
jgi:hypothetical protein